ncbi:hypothetical protein BGX38DRAFT_815615 [Terfezia claveryi]|nr:hypothetical protein BGX38DRAFT_815615 [Terfezia claveryi]
MCRKVKNPNKQSIVCLKTLGEGWQDQPKNPRNHISHIMELKNSVILLTNFCACVSICWNFSLLCLFESSAPRDLAG